MAARIFEGLSLRNLNYIKSTKKRTSYIFQKKRKTQIHKILKFPSTNFIILKALHNNLIINASSYISFKILVK